MCGLVGMAGTLSVKLRDVMKDLLFFDTLRGRDSTGVGVARRSRQVLLKKSTVPGYEFIESPNFNDWLLATDQLWMGHNRFKTVGDANRANAHPFTVLDEDELITIMGAHNGTLRNKYEIEKILDGDRFGTDSEALMNLIAERGIKEAIAEAQGAWSLTVWDATKNTINFIRNKDRPLVYGFTKDRKTIIWASETWMILAACRRNGIELYEEKNSEIYCRFTNEDTLYSLEIPQKSGDEFGDFVKEGGVQGKPEPAFHRHQGYASGRAFWEGVGDSNVDDLGEPIPEATPKAGKEEQKPEPAKRETITIGTPPSVIGGQSITKSKVDELRKKGCAWCGDPITAASPTFFSQKELICPPCLHGTDDRKAYVLRRDKLPEKLVERMPNNVIKLRQEETTNRLRQIVDKVKKGA